MRISKYRSIKFLLLITLALTFNSFVYADSNISTQGYTSMRGTATAPLPQQNKRVRYGNSVDSTDTKTSNKKNTISKNSENTNNNLSNDDTQINTKQSSRENVGPKQNSMNYYSE